ncbi:hypothetical protein Cni_G03227 [Canna indica]|uniref:DUF4283 domain-containing protein n=1 Tax=Canna indica TaxID=4628 RepID=A0AAQ3Q1G6_9LILI|nr:hypothetical protein Cni_G03227 [Canna indica]
MNVAGVVKDWLLIDFSWCVIRNTITTINLLSYGVAFLGVAYYNHAKLQALKAKESQRKTQQDNKEYVQEAPPTPRERLQMNSLLSLQILIIIQDLKIREAKKLTVEKQKRIDAAQNALLLLHTTCIVWPNAASEVFFIESFDGWTNKIVDLSGGFFAFKFTSEEEYWEVYTGGSWFFRGQALSLMQWRENFQPLKEEINIIPTWIQLSGLLYEFLHESILPQIAAVIGKPVKFDEYTRAGTRGKFARICVLLDVKKQLEHGFWIETRGGKFFQSVAYENLPVICYSCGRIGHREEIYNLKKDNSGNKELVKERVARDVQMGEGSNDSLMGPWI